MKKNHVLISLVWLLMLVFAWCGKSTTVDVTDSSTTVTENECMRGCQMVWKANEGNKWKTSSQMDKDCNNLCDATQGIQNNDLSSCAKSDWILRDGCYSEIAKKTKDASVCENITDVMFKNACYTSVAEEAKDVSICEKISDVMFKKTCLDAFDK